MSYKRDEVKAHKIKHTMNLFKKMDFTPITHKIKWIDVFVAKLTCYVWGVLYPPLAKHLFRQVSPEILPIFIELSVMRMQIIWPCDWGAVWPSLSQVCLPYPHLLDWGSSFGILSNILHHHAWCTWVVCPPRVGRLGLVIVLTFFVFKYITIPLRVCSTISRRNKSLGD